MPLAASIPAAARSMCSQKILSSLKEASTSATGRPKRARLRDVFDGVQAAIASGVSTPKILEILASDGLVYTAAALHVAMSQIRKERKLQPPHAKPPSQFDGSKSGTPDTAIVSNLDSTPGVVGSHDPADLNKIFSQKPDLAALAKLAKPPKRASK